MQHEKARTWAEHRLESVQNPCSPCGREINFELVLSLMSYDPNTGLLTWLERASKRWNTNFAGKEAFTAVTENGYKVGTVLYVHLLAHRVAWLLHYGKFPDGVIDHINGDRTDNRIENLRDVSSSANSRNSKRSAANTSGISGVSWHSRDKKWRATIYANRRHLSLGYFSSLEDAAKARKAAEVQYGFHDNHGRQS